MSDEHNLKNAATVGSTPAVGVTTSLGDERGNVLSSPDAQAGTAQTASPPVDPVVQLGTDAKVVGSAAGRSEQPATVVAPGQHAPSGGGAGGSEGPSGGSGSPVGTAETTPVSQGESGGQGASAASGPRLGGEPGMPPAAASALRCDRPVRLVTSAGMSSRARPRTQPLPSMVKAGRGQSTRMETSSPQPIWRAH
jgi:hypothetical protein